MVYLYFRVFTMKDGESFLFFLNEHWTLVCVVVVGSIGPVIWHHLQRNTVWEVLYADYSTAPNIKLDRNAYPAVTGVMKIDEEEYEISTAPTEIGLVLSRPDGASLFFTWMKIKDIRVMDRNARNARIQIRRRNSMPLAFEVPWVADFKDAIPKDVQYFFDPGQIEAAIEEITR